MSMVVTRATGHLGCPAVAALLDRGVAAGDIVAAGRNRARLAALDARGSHRDVTRPHPHATEDDWRHGARALGD
jgi:NAD(P)H dehydrogenase (quinone)